MRHGSLFTGTAMLDVGVLDALDGSLDDLAWVCDSDPGASKVLAHRLPEVPNLGDITAVDWSQVEPVDVLTGGFPCQDVSHAGRRAGMRPGTRSGLWASMADAIDQLRPRLVVAENVRGLLSAGADSDVESCPWCVGDGEGEPPLRALGAVLGDLAELGFDAEWVGVRASDVGAPHGRFRVFIAAWPAADHADRIGRTTGHHGQPGAAATRPGALAADGSGDGRDERRPEPAGQFGRPDAAERGAAAADADGHAIRPPAVTVAGSGHPAVTRHAGQAPAHPDSTGGEARIGRQRTGDAGRLQPVVSGDTDWGDYAPAIHRWERTLGRVAPAPTEPGAKGGQRLSPAFVEWLMGWPAGWVTDVPGLTRNDRLKLCGNGVVPQQASAALRLLLALAGQDLPHPVPGQPADGGDLLLGDTVLGEHPHRLMQRGPGAAVVPQGAAGGVGGHGSGPDVEDQREVAVLVTASAEVDPHPHGVGTEQLGDGQSAADVAVGLIGGERAGDRLRHADESALLVGTLSTTSRQVAS